MKKFLADTASQMAYYTLLLALAFGALAGQKNILGVAVTAFWVVIALEIIIGHLALFLTYGAEHIRDEKSKAESIQTAKKITKRKNFVARWWGWFCMVLTIVLLAYSGWVFTAVCYAISSLFVRLCVSLARDKVEKLESKIAA